MYFMLFQHINHRNPGARFLDQNSTKIIERFKVRIRKTFFNLIKQISKTKIIDSSVKLESLEISTIKSIRRLEVLFVMNAITKTYLKMSL